MRKSYFTDIQNIIDEIIFIKCNKPVKKKKNLAVRNKKKSV